MIGATRQTVSIAWLASFRILFGLTMCGSMIRFIAYGWIDPFFVLPQVHFTYFGFGWIQPLPGPAMHALFMVLAILALAMACGLWFRITALAFAAGFTYLQLVDVTTYLNHYYLAALLAWMLAFSPAQRAWSLDVLFSGGAFASVPAAWLWLFRFQIGVVYTFAGIAKATEDWLVHHQPLSIWVSARTGMPLLGPLLSEPWIPAAMSWAGFLFDTTIPWLLLWRRTRLYAFALVIVFHVLTRVLFPIGMFPLIMVLGALVFFPPDWPRQLRIRMPEGEHARRFALWPIAALYCAVQLLLPLRQLAYGGNVSWHEQGMRFSWRVMLREKNGSVTFLVKLPNGHTQEIDPGRYLTRVQEREMSTQPDLILQLAHHIRDEYAARGLAVEVRAEALVSLNGRRAALLIDPRVDLASISDGLANATWILPPPDQDPPHIRPLAQNR